MTPAPDPTAMSTYYGVTVYQSPADYTAQTGLACPPTNPNYPEKNWVGSGVFQGWNGSDTQPALTQFDVLTQQNSVNFPNVLPAFPSYTVAPTTATESTAGQTAPVQPNTLSTMAQADTLASIISGAVVFAPSEQSTVSTYNWGTETRRDWTLKFPNGDTQNVGLLLQNQNAQGIGYPGTWDTTSGALVWSLGPAPSASVAPGPAVNIPLNLPAGAALISVVLGLGNSVVEVQLPGTAPTAGTQTSGITPAQVSAIEAKLDAIAAWFHITPWPGD